MKKSYVLLFLSLFLFSCSDDDSSSPNTPETPSIKVSATQPDVMMPVAAGNTYIYKNISDSLIYDTLHPTNRLIFFTNRTNPIIQSDETCYHNKDFITNYLNLDMQVCGVNKEKNLFMSAWGANYESLNEGETLNNSLFFYDTLDIGTQLADFKYKGKENLVINGETFLNCSVYDDYSNETSGSRKLKFYLYKGVGLLKTLQTSKATGDTIEILLLQSCKIK